MELIGKAVRCLVLLGARWVLLLLDAPRFLLGSRFSVLGDGGLVEIQMFRWEGCRAVFCQEWPAMDKKYQGWEYYPSFLGTFEGNLMRIICPAVFLST